MEKIKMLFIPKIENSMNNLLKWVFYDTRAEGVWRKGSTVFLTCHEGGWAEWSMMRSSLFSDLLSLIPSNIYRFCLIIYAWM